MKCRPCRIAMVPSLTEPGVHRCPACGGRVTLTDAGYQALAVAPPVPPAPPFRPLVEEFSPEFAAGSQ